MPSNWPVHEPGAITLFPGAPNGNPVGIVAGPDGNLWVAESWGGLVKVTTSGVTTEVPVPAGCSVNAITAGTDGNLWFTDGGNNAIGRISF